MGYNLYIDRKVSSDYEYAAFILEGDGFYSQRVFRKPLGINSKLSYLETVKDAANVIKSMFEYKEIPANDVDFFTTHKTLAGYIRFFLNDENGIKPPAEYFDATYAAYTALEGMGVCYDIKYAEWATSPKSIANAKAFEKQGIVKHEKAIDAFKDIVEE